MKTTHPAIATRRSPFTLRFESTELERQFAQSMFPADTMFARVGLSLATVLYAAFGILDLWIVPPDFIRTTWTIRGVIMLLLVGGFLLTFSRFFRSHSQLIQMGLASLGSLGVVALILVVPEQTGHLFYAALIMAFIFLYIVIGLRFINALIVNLTILLAYNIVILAFKEVPVYLVINNNFLLISNTVVVAIAGYIIEHQRRVAFLNARILEDLRENADAANAAKSRFFANMSHELRTPLNAIIGYSEILLEEAIETGDSRCAADLSRIGTAGHHLLHLINDALDLAKIEAGKLEIADETVELTELVHRIDTTIRPLALRNGNQLRVDISAAPSMIHGDSLRIEQVLINLLSNACKFTKGGEIELAIRTQGWQILFSVRDTGIGMDADQLSGLFDEYIQADRNISREHGGTGLGLAISLQLVEMMGGTISVDSSPGKGSTFVVSLPFLGVDEGDAPTRGDQPAGSQA